MRNVIIEIKENNGNTYRITQTGKYRFISEGPGTIHKGGKSHIGFTYQILVDMVKLEPERFDLVIDNGQLLGFEHYSIHTLEGIIKLYPMFYSGKEEHWIETCWRELDRAQKVIAYDQEHGIKTQFYTGWDPSGSQLEELIKTGSLYYQDSWNSWGSP